MCDLLIIWRRLTIFGPLCTDWYVSCLPHNVDNVDNSRRLTILISICVNRTCWMDYTIAECLLTLRIDINLLRCSLLTLYISWFTFSFSRFICLYRQPCDTNAPWFLPAAGTKLIIYSSLLIDLYFVLKNIQDRMLYVAYYPNVR